MRRQTILVLSYHYAPSAAVGAKRFSYLAREFERLGHEVQIVAAPVREGVHGDAMEDASLPVAREVRRVAESWPLPLHGRSFGVRSINAFWRRVLAPVGWEAFWIGPAVRAALRAAAGARAGVVIATVPPHSAALAGVRVARKLGWPLILDYRDPWSAYPWPPWRKGSIGQWLARGLEAYCVRRSAARVLNTPEMRAWFARYFPRAMPQRNFVITNGFDPPGRGLVAEAGADEWRLVHAGALYTDRSLVPVLQAVRRIGLRAGRPIRVINYGEVPERERRRIRAEKLEDLLQIRPRISRDELLPCLGQARVLLAISGADMRYSAPYKVYDYLAAGRPILGVCEAQTALARLIADTGAGAWADPGDIAGIGQAVEQLLRRPAPLSVRTDDYLWSNLGHRYCEVIEAITRGAGSARTAGDALRAAHQSGPRG